MPNVVYIDTDPEFIETIRIEERKQFGKFLAARGMPGQDGSYPHFVRVEIAEIEALKQGKLPEGV